MLGGEQRIHTLDGGGKRAGLVLTSELRSHGCALSLRPAPSTMGRAGVSRRGAHPERWYGQVGGAVDELPRSPVMPVGVMVVDDQPQFRWIMREVIGAVPDFEIVGECSSGEQSLGEAAARRPDLVLMDVRMPGMGGVEAARKIVDAQPDTVVLLISAQEADCCLPRAAASSGAAAFVRKQDLRPRHLVELWNRHRRLSAAPGTRAR
jgi:two-component system invasion response regulator UvrY